MSEHERLSRMSPEDLQVLIDIERAARLPRWLVVLVVVVSLAGFGACLILR